MTNYTKCIIYNTIVFPHHEYCSTLMINYTDDRLDVLQKLQNRAMRAILNVNKYTSVSLMLKTLSWMSRRQRIIYNTCLFVFKMKNKLYPNYLNDEIKFHYSHYNTRNKGLLKIAHTRTHSAEKTIVFKGYKWFNNLTDEIKEEDRINVFKMLLKNFIKINIGYADKI